MLKNITIILVGVSWLYSCYTPPEEIPNTQITTTTVDTAEAPPPKDYNDSLWTEIDFETGFVERMAYADTANFMGQKIYPCPRCFLRPEAATALQYAQKLAQQKGLRLLLFDCYRPSKYQQKMFDIVQNPRYVAQPKNGGSMHNKGLAVDVALADANGQILDFGGAFDDFTPNAHHGHEGLDAVATQNRISLKKLMVEAGFTPYQYEWWHYSFRTVEYALDDFIWHCNPSK